jgi:flagellar hook-length control protein FliK
MSSIAAQMLTATAPGAPKAAGGAAGLFASKGEPDGEAAGAFEALLGEGAAAVEPRQADAPAAGFAVTGAAQGEPSADEALAAALRGAPSKAGPEQGGVMAPPADGDGPGPAAGAIKSAEANPAKAPAPATPAMPDPAASAPKSAEPAAGDAKPAPPAQGAQFDPSGASDGETSPAPPAKPDAAKAMAASLADEPRLPGGLELKASTGKANPAAPTAEPGAAGRDAGKASAVPAQPAEPALEAAASQAAFKRASGEAAAEPMARDGRGASDIAAARAPGEQVRAAARAGGSEPAAKPGERPSVAAASATGAEPAPVKPASAPSPAAPVPPGLAAALMNSAALASFTAAFAGEAGVETASEGEAELDLAAAGARGDARAEVQRQSMPHAANAHAAARFQPQTVQTLAARIAARAVDGARVFDIRLDPAELGRVEVRLELGADNSVRALLSAERADTLAELQRSARDLEKALAEAGLDLADDGLSFSLSDDGAPSDGEAHDAPRFSTAAWSRSDAAGAEAPAPGAPARLYGFELAARRGLDVRT